MRLISNALDRLPEWAQWVLGLLSLAGIVYGTAHYGFSFLLRVLLSP
jgi:hypothetical protein